MGMFYNYSGSKMAINQMNLFNVPLPYNNRYIRHESKGREFLFFNTGIVMLTEKKKKKAGQLILEIHCQRPQVPRQPQKENIQSLGLPVGYSGSTFD